MAPRNDLKAEMMKSRSAELRGGPKLAEVKVDVNAKDFETALDEVAAKAEALVAIAPPEKQEKLQGVADMLKQCQAETEGEEDPNTPDEIEPPQPDETKLDEQTY